MNIKVSKINTRKLGEATTGIVVSIVRWIFLLSISYILLYPLIYMISQGFRATADFTDPTVIWVPKSFSLISFKNAWKALEYPKSLLNTVVIEIVSALLEVVMCSITAYGLARFKFKERGILTFILIVTILVPTQLIMIPLMTSMRYLDVFGLLGLFGELIGTDIRPNLLNTPFAFYLPSVLAVGLKAGLFTYMYVQFFKSLPKELEEASAIDGAGPLKTFVRVVVPSSGNIFLTVTIFSIIWHWNDIFLAKMFLSKDFPLSVALSRIVTTLQSMGYNAYGKPIVGAIMAGCLLVILPVLIMYCVLQKKFIKSIDSVGIVG